MVVVAHQAVSMADPRKPADAFRQEAKELLSVFVAKEHRRIAIATRGDMVDRSGKINA